MDAVQEQGKTSVDWFKVLEEAFNAAQEAAATHIASNPGLWYPCGFAWVNIKPARGPVITALKALGDGYTDSYYGGYTVLNPSRNTTQWMDAKEQGARAFLAVLKKYGVKGSVGTRLD